MVKLYGSTQHSAVQLLLAKIETAAFSTYSINRTWWVLWDKKCQQSTILNDITWRLPSQTNDVRMSAPSVRMSNIVQRVNGQLVLLQWDLNLDKHNWLQFGRDTHRAMQFLQLYPLKKVEPNGSSVEPFGKRIKCHCAIGWGIEFMGGGVIQNPPKIFPSNYSNYYLGN